MATSSPLWNVVAWLLFPLVLLLVSTGLGLLVEKVLRFQVPPGLVAPLGFCVSIVLVMPGYRLGAPAPLAVALVLSGSVAGFLLSRRELRTRLNTGWVALAGIATYVLFIAPTALSGGWTWSGYNLLNDTAVQLVLAQHLKAAGAMIPGGPPSTQSELLKVYIGTRYPLGSHAELATMSELLGAPPAVLYQSYLSVMAGLAAMALATLARRIGFSGLGAVAVAVTSVGASLFYSYALQGSVKEVAMFATLAIAAAVARELLGASRPVGLAAAVGLCGAASLAVYSAAAIPYVGALAVAVLAGSFVVRGSALRGVLLPAAGVATATFAVASIPTAAGIVTFSRTVNASFGAPALAPQLGQLARPLPLKEAAGVWLAGDYRLAVPSHRLELITQVMIILMVLLLVVGVVFALRIREPGPLVFLLPAAVTLAVVAPRVSPYADAKMLAILSPAVVFTAACGLLVLRRLWLPLSLGVGLILALGVLGSDAYGYHDTKLAPIKRLQALQDVGDRLAGRGMVLVNEFEEFAKYAASSAQVNTATEAITPMQVQLRSPTYFFGYYFDLDDQVLGYVERFPFIVKRRSPDASRPPMNYRLTYANSYYEVWQRTSGPQVVGHLPLQEQFSPTAVARCAAVSKVARLARAAPGREVVAAVRPELSELHPAAVSHPAGWTLDPTVPGDIRLNVPGAARGQVRVHGGDYTVWVQGSFGRPVYVMVDGRPAGHVEGINTPGQWLEAGHVRLAAGMHTMEVRRGGVSLRPGDGAVSDLGPVALEASGATRLQSIPLGRVRQLCGRAFDWIEVVQR